MKWFKVLERASIICLTLVMWVTLIFVMLNVMHTCTASASADIELKKRSEAFGADCSKHEIYCHIVFNKRNIDREYAMKLSNIIYKKAKQYKVSPFLYSAIIAQESMYKLSAKNCTTGYTMYKEDNVQGFTLLYDKIRTVCTDFGLSQIHYKTVKRYNFEIEKLVTDLEYSVDAGMQVLSDFKKKYKHKELTWWSRYNSSTPTKRRIYETLVDKYL